MSDSESDYEYDSYESGSDSELSKSCISVDIEQQQRHKNEKEYNILSYEEVTPIMKNLISEVSNLLDVTEAVTEVLLRQHKWNKELLFNEYCSAEETFWSKAGVTRVPKASADSSSSPPSKALATRKKRKETFFCGICCDDECLRSDGFGLDCDHSFCK